MRGRDRDASTPRSRRLKRNNVPGFGLLLCAIAGAGRPVRPRRRSGVPSACAAVAANGTFFRNALDSCERLMRTPSRASISARRLTDRPVASVGHRLLQQGRDHNATPLHSSPELGRAPRSLLAPQCRRPRSHCATGEPVSSCTPNASAIRGLVQPVSVSSTARALSASPRSREPASLASAARCSLVAVSGDFPAMSCTCDSAPAQNQNPMRWSIERILL